MKIGSKASNSQSKFTNEDLKTMQSWDLDRKIAVSLTKIAEFHAKYPHEIYVLSHQTFVMIIAIVDIRNKSINGLLVFVLNELNELTEPMYLH